MADTLPFSPDTTDTKPHTAQKQYSHEELYFYLSALPTHLLGILQTIETERSEDLFFRLHGDGSDPDFLLYDPEYRY